MNTVSRSAEKLCRQRIKKAAYWVSLLEDESRSTVDEIDFKQWCAQHPDNKKAYDELLSVMTRFENFSEQEAGAMKAVFRNTSVSTSLYSKSGFGISLSVILGLYTWYAQSGYSAEYLMSDYRASTNEVREIKLPDGSQVTLDAMSSFNVSYSNNERRIELTQGRLFADVVTNPARPFIVETDTATVTALGTQFAVNNFSGEAKITITESKVELCNKQLIKQNSSQSSCIIGQAGEVMGLVGGRLYGPVLSNVRADTSWLEYRMVVNNQPLSEVLEGLSRHYHGMIFYSDANIKDVRVSGVYPTDNIQLSLSMLSKHAGINATKLSDEFHIIRKDAQ